MFNITVYKDGVEQASYPLSAGALHLGRAEGNEILLPEDSVSRRHARLFVEAGRLFVEDLGSGNGTYIGNQRIEGRVELGADAEVHVTPFILVVQAGLSDATTAPLPGKDVSTQLISPPESSGGQPERTGARLILRRGEAGKSSYMLTTGVMTIGRSEERDVVLTDPASSRQHATLTFMGDHYYVKDEGSANGLVVNNEPTREAVLVHGDRLIIGETEFELIWPGAPQRNSYNQPPGVGGGGLEPSPQQDPAPQVTQAMPVQPPPYGMPQNQAGGGYYQGGVDPYSETGVMPTYDAMAVQQQAVGMAGAQQGYAPPGGYGVELGVAPVKKRSPLRLVAVLLVAVLGLAIVIKVVSDRGDSSDKVSGLAQNVDPCANVGDTCPDSSDQICLNCLNKRARLARGRELFAQKEFGQAIQEFQRILQDIDPLDHDAMQLRYISYEFWVLTALDDTVQDRSQTVSQKLEKIKKDLEAGRKLVDRYGRGYSTNASEATLSRARSKLNEAVSLFNGVSKVKLDDAEADSMKEEAEKLRSKALSAIYRLKVVKQASAKEAFVQEVEDIFDRATAAKANGKLSQASSLFKQVIAKDPEDKSGKVVPSRQELGAIDRALKATARPLYDEALIKMRNEQWIEARRKLQQAVKIDPEFAEAQGKLLDANRECVARAEKLYSEAKVQFNIGQHGQAEKLLQQVLRYAPAPSESVNQKAKKMLKDMGKL